MRSSVYIILLLVTFIGFGCVQNFRYYMGYLKVKPKIQNTQSVEQALHIHISPKIKKRSVFKAGTTIDILHYRKSIADGVRKSFRKNFSEVKFRNEIKKKGIELEILYFGPKPKTFIFAYDVNVYKCGRLAGNFKDEFLKEERVETDIFNFKTVMTGLFKKRFKKLIEMMHSKLMQNNLARGC